MRMAWECRCVGLQDQARVAGSYGRGGRASQDVFVLVTW